MEIPGFKYFESQFSLDRALLQSQILLDLQLSHNERLEELGMLDKARAVLSEDELNLLGGFTLASVHMRESMEKDKRGIWRIRQSACIKISTPLHPEEGPVNSWGNSYVEVMHRYQEDLSLEMDNGFDSDEGMELLMMADELMNARDEGTLSLLSSSFSGILLSPSQRNPIDM